MVGYATQVSWVLIAAFGLSLLYELYRSTPSSPGGATPRPGGGDRGTYLAQPRPG